MEGRPEDWICVRMWSDHGPGGGRDDNIVDGQGTGAGDDDEVDVRQAELRCPK